MLQFQISPKREQVSQSFASPDHCLREMMKREQPGMENRKIGWQIDAAADGEIDNLSEQEREDLQYLTGGNGCDPEPRSVSNRENKT